MERRIALAALALVLGIVVGYAIRGGRRQEEEKNMSPQAQLVPLVIYEEGGKCMVAKTADPIHARPFDTIHWMTLNQCDVDADVKITGFVKLDGPGNYYNPFEKNSPWERNRHIPKKQRGSDIQGDVHDHSEGHEFSYRYTICIKAGPPPEGSRDCGNGYFVATDPVVEIYR
jgi:hypothetical protein